MSTRRPGDSDGDERIETPPVPRGGTYTIQVSAYAGAWSPRPYALRIQTRPAPALPPCEPRVPPFDGDGNRLVTAGTQIPSNANTLFVVNERRYADHHSWDAAMEVRHQLDGYADSLETEGTGVIGGILAVE